ncbi:hypothetical protein GFL58_07090 [Rhizobium leguminosarum bv. viciae]|nr:hypothetical protein [Rhizobium leguminosarum bv. viciae]
MGGALFRLRDLSIADHLSHSRSHFPECHGDLDAGFVVTISCRQAIGCCAGEMAIRRIGGVLAGRLELNTVRRYLTVIGVAGECSTRAFATAEVAYLLLTTDVLALV